MYGATSILAMKLTMMIYSLEIILLNFPYR